MDKKRIKRYKSKIERIEKRLNEIKIWKKSFFEEERNKLAIYKAFQEVVEASMDIIAMILKDNKKMPEDDYTNITKVCGDYIDEKNKPVLIELNGLRNRIVHEYNGLDERLALESMDNLSPEITGFLNEVKKWLKLKI